MNTFDLIREFRLDRSETHYEGITQVPGSNGIQRAYRLQRQSNLTLRSFEAFPQGILCSLIRNISLNFNMISYLKTKGIPHQFSFECAFRAREQPVTPWYLFHVTNYYEESQLAVTMYPEQETLGLALPDANGRLQNVFFQHKILFDQSWHKVMLGVTPSEARLWVDCKQVVGVHGDYVEPLEARGGFDTRGGHLYVSQMMKINKEMEEETVPVCHCYEQTVFSFI